MLLNPKILPVSILMPVYNAGKYLKECLDSIINQDFSNWELIAIDDFSEDNSSIILSEYAKKDQRIKCYQNKEKGIIPALKLAFSIAKYPLISRMDADDIMPTSKLQILSEQLLESGKKYISTGKIKYFSNQSLGDGFEKYEKWINKLIDSNNHWDHIYKECVIPSACWMAFRSDLEFINAFAESEYPEDYDLIFRMYQSKFKIIASSEVLHLWRDHPDRASRNDPNYADQQFFHLKVKYFLKLDFNSDQTLFLWGAGKKGKRLAQLLKSENIPFRWVSNNENKIGHQIYGVLLEPSEVLEQISNKQVITAIADTTFISEKERLFQTYNLSKSHIFEF